jgi:hypothetical protein
MTALAPADAQPGKRAANRARAGRSSTSRPAASSRRVLPTAGYASEGKQRERRHNKRDDGRTFRWKGGSEQRFDEKSD